MNDPQLIGLAITAATHQNPEPINWDVVASVLVPVVVAALGAWGYIASRKAQKGTPEHHMIDQLQEQIDRLEVRQTRFEARDRVYIPHIIRLNMHIDQNLGPPAPKIPKVIQEYLDEQED